VPISIIIFEDNDKLRESLCVLLSGLNEYKVIGEYDNCREADTITRVYKPDVVLMDIDMPGSSVVLGVPMIK
jgi:DNA-binding NarL/FixJ family response regulator